MCEEELPGEYKTWLTSSSNTSEATRRERAKGISRKCIKNVPVRKGLAREEDCTSPVAQLPLPLGFQVCVLVLDRGH